MNEEDVHTACNTFLAHMEKQHENNIGRMSKTYKQYKHELHELQYKAKDKVVNLSEFMVTQLKHDPHNAMLKVVCGVMKHPEYAEALAEVFGESLTILKKRKWPRVVQDKRQFVFGRTPCYFVDIFDDGVPSLPATSDDEASQEEEDEDDDPFRVSEKTTSSDSE